jgi:hypothetical protein
MRTAPSKIGMLHLSEVTGHLVYDGPHKFVTINPITSVPALLIATVQGGILGHMFATVPATHKTDTFHHTMYQLCYLYTQLTISKHTAIN